MLARHLALATAAGALAVAGSALAAHSATALTRVAALPAPADSGWTATLSAPSTYSGSEHVSGSATVTPDPSGKGFVAHVTIDGAKPNAVHPWHVHTGTCDKSDGIVGAASAYPPIKVGADGKGMATATVTKPLTAGGEYIVNVHESRSSMKTIVACGALTAQP